MKLIKRLIFFICICVTAFCGFFIWKGYSAYRQVKSEIRIEDKIDMVRDQKNYTPFLELPDDYVNAVVAVEDHRFYDHNGFDFLSVVRSVYNNIRFWRLYEGGSTITQQVAKNIFFTQEKSLIRKTAEIFMAFDLEKLYSKDDILELYVNTNYFGSGYYGIKEASLGYFKKEPQDMTLYEATLLAGIPNAPSVYAPTKNPDLARSRQLKVIEAMVKNGYISREEADEL